MVIIHKTKGKFQLKWEGLFVVKIVYSNGAYRLANPNSDMLMMQINGFEEVLFVIILTLYL